MRDHLRQLVSMNEKCDERLRALVGSSWLTTRLKLFFFGKCGDLSIGVFVLCFIVLVYA